MTRWPSTAASSQQCVEEFFGPSCDVMWTLARCSTPLSTVSWLKWDPEKRSDPDRSDREIDQIDEFFFWTPRAGRKVRCLRTCESNFGQDHSIYITNKKISAYYLSVIDRPMDKRIGCLQASEWVRDITAVVTVVQGSAMNSNNVLGGSYFALFVTGTNTRHRRPLHERKWKENHLYGGRNEYLGYIWNSLSHLEWQSIVLILPSDDRVLLEKRREIAMRKIYFPQNFDRLVHEILD